MEKSKIIENAQQYALRGQLTKAIEEWKKLLADTPNDAGVYNTIGDLHLRNRASQEAVEAYLQAGEIFHSSGFTAKAIAVFQKILKISPERKDIYLRIGEMNVERGMVGNARESFLKVARLYTQEGMIRESLEVFRKIADLDPSNLSVRLKIAEACLKEGLKGEAIEEYLKIAEAHLKRGQTSEAEGLYRQILGFDPGNWKALLEIGRCHLTGDHPEAAAGYADKILEDHPDSVEALSLLLETYLRMERIEMAEETVRRLIALDPGHLPYQEKMAEIALRHGNFDLAAATLIPVGSAYLQRGEYTRAMESFQPLMQRGGEEVVPVDAVDILFHSALGLGQTDRIVQWGLRLGRVYQEMGESEKALGIYEQVLKWSPSQEEAQAESRRLAPPSEVVTPIPSVEEGFHEITLAESESVGEIPSPEPVSRKPSSLGGVIPEEDRISEHLNAAVIYVKYGLIDKAVGELNAVLALDPRSEEAHLHLKEIYKGSQETAKAVKSCLALSEIYRLHGEPEKEAGILRQARDLSPDDIQVNTRLRELGELEERKESPPRPKPVRVEDIGELWEEAEFYAQQGMVDESVEVCGKILSLSPEHEGARSLLVQLKGPVALEPEKAPEVEEPGIAFPPLVEPEPEFLLGEGPEPETIPSPPEAPGFFDLEEALKDETAPFPAGEGEAMKSFEEIFQEFQEGVRDKFGEEDFETHYNLGIAYREMGLLEEAVGEFQLALKGDSRFFDASHMLAECFRDLGRPQQALDILDRAIDHPLYADPRYSIIKYSKGLLLEGMGAVDDAEKVYTEIHNADPTYRDVAERVLSLRKRMTPE